jgi:hypothetical protein
MSGVEASIGIGVQVSGFWNPAVKYRSQALPAYLGTLAAAHQYIAPHAI